MTRWPPFSTSRSVSYTTQLDVTLVAGCSSPAKGPWTERVVEPPGDTAEVVAAVASLPECGAALQRGGIIEWRAVITDCPQPGTPDFQPPWGCTHLDEDPVRIEVALRYSAWDPPPSGSNVSTLAHELCHVCGYVDGPDYQTQADGCALRAELQRR